MPGPIPKRSDIRVRRNKPEANGGVPLTRGTARGFRAFPAPGEHWDESTIRTYNSFQNSGMVDYFEETDIELIWQACDQLHTFRQGRRSAQQYDLIMKWLSNLGATEAERRRMRIELVSPTDHVEEAPELALVADFKNNPAIIGG